MLLKIHFSTVFLTKSVFTAWILAWALTIQADKNPFGLGFEAFVAAFPLIIIGFSTRIFEIRAFGFTFGFDLKFVFGVRNHFGAFNRNFDTQLTEFVFLLIISWV